MKNNFQIAIANSAALSATILAASFSTPSFMSKGANLADISLVIFAFWGFRSFICWLLKYQKDI
ncbi:hypothetical protein [Dryocola sp. BD613]|uniref:hypothetical protein n=1 Tax=Dryocola sp. BD613 TaxID=3133272 RepID=UPI003F50AF53